MHFDDRLATVLHLPSSGDALARIQYRQLIDILGSLAEDAHSAAIEAGFARVVDLSSRIPATDRARLVRQPLQPLTNPRLLALFAEAEPEVAMAAIGIAQLDEDAWLALVPALPVRARGILRHRRDLGAKVEALLERLGVRDRGLPPVEEGLAEEEDKEHPLDLVDAVEYIEPEPPTAPRVEPATFAGLEQIAAAGRAAVTPPDARGQRVAKAGVDAGAEAGAGIGAIVRRIEEFRKARENHGSAGAASKPGGDAPHLPLDDSSKRATAAIDFATDAEGRINWVDGSLAGALVGLNLAGLDPSAIEPSPHPQTHYTPRPGLALSMRHRQPLRAIAVDIAGAPAVSGSWQVDAVPHFDPASGRFIGYAGRLRRPAKIAAIDAPPTAEPSEADRMRQVLHELRTPANAIQVAAEIIQQQLYGPAPHEYRALAAAIAGDCAHILAGFEELDRLVKLESGALGIESGESDLASVLAETVSRLKAWTEPRSSGFVLPELGYAPSPVAIERAEIERLVWRIFAVLAGMTAPQEMLPVRLSMENGRVAMRVALPSLLLTRDAQSLFDTPVSERGQSLSTGMFGIGFTLRLAAAEAAAAGGGLQREEDDLYLSLPAAPAAEQAGSRAI